MLFCIISIINVNFNPPPTPSPPQPKICLQCLKVFVMSNFHLCAHSAMYSLILQMIAKALK